MPIENHTLVSKNIGYYLHKFRAKLDMILETIWQEFKETDWEVKHQVRATNLSDKNFTHQYALLIDNR